MMMLALPTAAQNSNCGAPSQSIAEGAFSGFMPNSLPRPPCAEPSLPPNTVEPFLTKKPSEFAEPPGLPLVADKHVNSTDLGFQQGVAPAPGRSVMMGGQKYRVIDVQAKNGGATFAGGSPFVIGVQGSILRVGLKAIQPGSLLDPDRLEVSVVN